ncbi:MAG: prepilin-type N-terminal cleavage/methylation domain-containing protein, partial [Candidatus Omnitrophica bacterium]|nr:prepilin-type N-terminal cleavage/methylation domain-containing protein [Candidatus Omnitrophota bacterium]
MNRKGFTLVEIMIVVAIIALLAAIAIPNLLRARHNANEAAAQSTLKSISTAAESFRSAQTTPAYPANDGAMTGATPPYLDAGIFAAAGRQGYIFSYTQLNNNQYVACGIPAVYQTSGTRTFAINETGVLRALDNTAAVINTVAGYNGMTV